MPPRVSIITPLYNGEKYLAETIQSVLDQTFQDWELVLVDDGSKDSSLEIAKDWAGRDSRIRFFSQPNAGVAATRDRAAKELSSDTEFLLFLDQDDLLEPYALDELIRAADEHRECVAVHGFLKIIDGEGKTIPDHFCENHNWLRQRAIDGRIVPTPINELTTFETLTYLLFIYTPGSVLIRRTAFLKTGGLDQSIAPADDWDLYLKLTLQGPMYPLPRTVTAWRLHGENNTFNRAKIMSTTDAVYERYLKSVNDPHLHNCLEDGFLQFTCNRLRDADESEDIQQMLRDRESTLLAKVAERKKNKRIRILVVLPSMAGSCELRDSLDLLGELADRIEVRFVALEGGDRENSVRSLGDCRNVEFLLKRGLALKYRISTVPRRLAWQKWIRAFNPDLIYLQSPAATAVFQAMQIPVGPALLRNIGTSERTWKPEKHVSRLEIVDRHTVPVGASDTLTISSARALDQKLRESSAHEPYLGVSGDCPHPILEAMLREEPIVYLENATDIASIAGGGGVAVPVNSAEEMNSTIEKLRLEPMIMAELGRKGRQRVYENFSISLAADKLFVRMQAVIA